MDIALLKLAESRAAMCRALGSTRRLLIVWLLSEGEVSVNEIAACVGSSLQNISQHLRLLRQAGIVTARRDGHTIYYRIADCESLRRCPAIVQASAPDEQNKP